MVKLSGVGDCSAEFNHTPAKARLQHIVTAAALNIVRAVAWLEGIPLAKTRQSHFARLDPSLLRRAGKDGSNPA